MAYATWQQMVARFGTQAMQDLDAGYVETGSTAETAVGGENYPGLVTALADASADIDARLATAWDLPLPAPPTQYAFLVAVACDLARLRLYDNDPTDAVLKRAEDSDRRLDQLLEGKRELVGSTAGRVTRRQTASLSEYVGPDAQRPNLRRDAADTGRYF